MGRSYGRLLAVVVGICLGLGLLAGAYGFVFGFGPDPGACACSPVTPSLAFEETPSESGVAVTIRHDGGDAVQAGRLHVSVDDRTRTWASLAGVSNESEVTAGDAVTVTADAGAVVRVYIGDDDVSHTVARHTVEA